MSDIDPLSGLIGALESAVGEPGAAATGDAATVEVGPDGTLRAIRLTEAGRRMDPELLVEAIVRLHADALAQSRAGVAAAIDAIENDPRLRAYREGLVGALQQPYTWNPKPR
ncbi:hypothetical protein JMUB6875_31130 [Nocardia sp. JMUB6875]|uniref:hypothetical protein n=1 Tax=Nocardia sp. JMUB6875 TaxID=3158170 RepID=UPI0032E711AF